jgi:hypothetical protein
VKNILVISEGTSGVNLSIKGTTVKGDNMDENCKYIRFSKDSDVNDVSLVGGKTASLGEMYRELPEQGMEVPDGFGIMAEASRYIPDKAKAWKDGGT